MCAAWQVTCSLFLRYERRRSFLRAGNLVKCNVKSLLAAAIAGAIEPLEQRGEVTLRVVRQTNISVQQTRRERAVVHCKLTSWRKSEGRE